MLGGTHRTGGPVDRTIPGELHRHAVRSAGAAVPGARGLQSQLVHTARYPREGIDFSGKRVGVVGSGATGIQVIQTIASQVTALKVFQRTSAYGVPMRNEAFDDETRDYWRGRAPELKQRLFSTLAGFDFDFDKGSWYEASPEVFFDEAVNAEVSEFVRGKIRGTGNWPKGLSSTATASALAECRSRAGTTMSITATTWSWSMCARRRSSASPRKG